MERPVAMRRRRGAAAQPFWSMTSVDLMTALTVSPFFKPISSALRRVMTLSIRFLPTRTVTCAMTSPSWMLTIFPGSWFLAERGIPQYYLKPAAAFARRRGAAAFGGTLQ